MKRILTGIAMVWRYFVIGDLAGEGWWQLYCLLLSPSSSLPPPSSCPHSTLPLFPPPHSSSSSLPVRHSWVFDLYWILLVIHYFCSPIFLEIASSKKQNKQSISFSLFLFYFILSFFFNIQEAGDSPIFFYIYEIERLGVRRDYGESMSQTTHPAASLIWNKPPFPP